MYSVSTWTKNLTNLDSPFVIKKEWGISQFTLVCRSVAPIQYRGGKTVAGMPSEDINLNQNDSYSFASNMPMDDFTITIPSGCTAELSAVL